MSRVTRSKKVEVAEDITADTLGFGTLPSLYTGQQIQPLAEIAVNTMEENVEDEVKMLKAAYRNALGANASKKGKKGKNKKKADVQQFEDVHLVQTDNVLVRHMRQETSQGSLVTRMSGLRLRDNLTGYSDDDLQLEKDVQSVSQPSVQDVVIQPAVRTTRRQAKAQEGSYEDLLADVLADGHDGTIGNARFKEPDYLMSLFAGRTVGPSRSLNNSIFKSSTKSGRTANDYLFIAEEALRKSSRESAKKDSINDQASDNVVTLDPEPKELVVSNENHKVMRTTATSSESANEPSSFEGEDSFVEQIINRSPAKPAPRVKDFVERTTTTPSPSKSAANPSNDHPSTPADEDGDSFLEQISTRSPAKPASRIEDLVEALDQMEEVEEALNQATMAEIMVSPEKTRQKAKAPAIKAEAPPATKPSRGQPTIKPQPGKPGYASMRVKPTATRTSVVKKATSMIFKPSDSSETSSIREEVSKYGTISKKSSVRRPISLLPPKEPAKSTKPVTRPTNFELPGEAVARKLKKQREARLAQRHDSSEDSVQTVRTNSGPSVKSTKPLTKPVFELPGEAVSRKKREAHEAKLKAQQEEERKRREFKAKPVRKSMITTIRDTVASRARQSRAGIENITDGNLTVSKRSSNVGAHRPSIQELHSMAANTSAPRAPAPAAPLARKPSTKFHGPSMSGLAMQRTVSASDVHVQKQRAKEIYNRDSKLAEDNEKERREREAAAKRSREEAAERGRQASKDWAAKQLAKKNAEGDKGMSAGYGPGGQLGLKA